MVTESCEDVFHDFSVHVGESETSALELVAQDFVIDSELIENGGLKVVHVDGILMVVMFAGVDRVAIGIDDFGAVFVGVAHGDSALDTTACHPH